MLHVVKQERGFVKLAATDCTDPCKSVLQSKTPVMLDMSHSDVKLYDKLSSWKKSHTVEEDIFKFKNRI